MIPGTDREIQRVAIPPLSAHSKIGSSGKLPLVFGRRNPPTDVPQPVAATYRSGLLKK